MGTKIGLGLIATIGGYLTYLEGAIGVPTFIMGVCIMLDVITGIGKAAKAGNIWSRTAWFGGLKKLWYIAAVLLATLVDYFIVWLGGGAIQGVVFDVPPIFSSTVSLWIIATESISIIENIEACGVKLPGFLKRLFETMKSKAEAAGEEQAGDGEPKE